MFRFPLETSDVIKLGIIESTDMGSLIGSSERYINKHIDGLLDGM